MKTYTDSNLLAGFDGDPIQIGTPGGRFVAMTLPCESEGATAEDEGNAQRLAACWNACNGLTLPADVPPGILTVFVRTVRDAAAALSMNPGNLPRCLPALEAALESLDGQAGLTGFRPHV